MSPRGPKIGRPMLPHGEAKTETLVLRLTLDEKQAIAGAAERDGESVSAWLRDVALEAASRRA